MADVLKSVGTFCYCLNFYVVGNGPADFSFDDFHIQIPERAPCDFVTCHLTECHFSIFPPFSPFLVTTASSLIDVKCSIIESLTSVILYIVGSFFFGANHNQPTTIWQFAERGRSVIICSLTCGNYLNFLRLVARNRGERHANIQGHFVKV